MSNIVQRSENLPIDKLINKIMGKKYEYVSSIRCKKWL